MADSFGPDPGKAWVQIEGTAGPDLFEVDADTPEAEITAAKAQYRKLYPYGIPYDATRFVPKDSDEGRKLQ